MEGLHTAVLLKLRVVRVVQGECGAGECGAVWCRARAVQNEVQVVQGECSAGYGAGWGVGRCGQVRCGGVVQENPVQPHYAGR